MKRKKMSERPSPSAPGSSPGSAGLATVALCEAKELEASGGFNTDTLRPQGIFVSTDSAACTASPSPDSADPADAAALKRATAALANAERFGGKGSPHHGHIQDQNQDEDQEALQNLAAHQNGRPATNSGDGSNSSGDESIESSSSSKKSSWRRRRGEDEIAEKEHEKLVPDAKPYFPLKSSSASISFAGLDISDGEDEDGEHDAEINRGSSNSNRKSQLKSPESRFDEDVDMDGVCEEFHQQVESKSTTKTMKNKRQSKKELLRLSTGKLSPSQETVEKLQNRIQDLEQEVYALRAQRNAMATALEGARVPICRHKGDEAKTLEWGNKVFWEKVMKRNYTESVRVGASLMEAGWPLGGEQSPFSWYEIDGLGNDAPLASLSDSTHSEDGAGTSSLDPQTGSQEEDSPSTDSPYIDGQLDSSDIVVVNNRNPGVFAVGFWTPRVETTGSLTRAALLDLLTSSALPATVAYLDRDGIYRFANEAYLRFVNQPRVVGLHYRDVLTKGVLDVIESRLFRAFQGERLSHCSTVPRIDGKVDEEGNPMFASYEVRSVPDVRNGAVQGVLIVAFDITERIVHEKALEKAKHEAEAASRAKSEFLSVITHEIRTPLVAVLGFAELLEKTPLSKQQEDMLKQIESSGELLLQLLNDILDMAKIEAGKLELEQGEVKLFTLLKTVHDITSGPAQRKQLDWTLEIGENVPAELIGDQARFSQILLNLLGNAIKFTPRGGRVVLRAMGLACNSSEGNETSIPYISSSSSSSSSSSCFSATSTIAFASARPTDDCDDQDDSPNHTKRLRSTSTGNVINVLCLEVQDSGIGISPDKIDRVFDAFTQGESSTTRKYGGTGLGLQLCKRLAALLGGELSVESELNVGSTFRVMIPIRLERDSHFLPPGCVNLQYLSQLSSSDVVNEQLMASSIERADSSSTAPPPPMDLHVLLVEDTPVNQVIMRRFLEAASVIVDTADNGEEALHKFKSTCAGVGRPYDVIFMDIQMPVMDGFDATRNIRKIEQSMGLDPIPIVALTAFAVKSDLQRCLEAGCDRFLIKPVKRKDLLSAIAQYAPTSSSS